MDNVLSNTFMACEASFDEADIVVFGAGYDGTATFRPGSRFAPAAMRADFYGLETYSPVLDRDLLDLKICDFGDLDLPFGTPQKALELVFSTAQKIVTAGKKPVMIGGEHLVTLPCFKAALRQYPDLCVIHLDAHTDLREDYLGEPLSHSTVIRRIWDLIGDDRIAQLGIRSGLKEEFLWAKEGHTYFYPFDLSQAKKAAAHFKNKPVYLTIDLDVLDPSVLPGTGTPEPGGVSFTDLQNALTAFLGLNIVAADIVELAPKIDSTGISTAAACKTLREVLLLLEK